MGGRCIMMFSKKKSILGEAVAADFVEEDLSKIEGLTLSDLEGKSVLVTYVKIPTEIKEVFVREVASSSGMVLLKFMDCRIPKWETASNFVVKCVLNTPERVLPPRS
jgi:hypothetical protein